MNGIATNPIIAFNPNQMAEVRKTFGYEDLNRLHQDIKLLEDWIKMQEHFVVKQYDKEYLERYLISNKGSIEQAKKRLDKLCTLRGLMPEYLRGFDIENEFEKLLKISLDTKPTHIPRVSRVYGVLTDMLLGVLPFTMTLSPSIKLQSENIEHLFVLPKTTVENYRIVLYAIDKPDAANFEHIHLVRYLLLTLQYLYCHDYNAGIVIIVDTRKFSFGIVSKLNPIIFSNVMTIMIDALGLRLRGIHLMSGSKFIDTIVTFIKQGLSKKLTSRLHVHEDHESLFKFIPKDILPKDLGGDIGTAQEICDKNFKEFSSPEFIRKFKYLESATTNESKRLCSRFNEQYSGMPGSFKVLTVD